MEILNTEIVNNSIPMLITWIGLILINMMLFFTNIKEHKKLATVNMLIVIVFTLFSAYEIISPKKYEKVQVKVNDWNEVMESEYEFVKQEGEIVTLKKQLQ